MMGFDDWRINLGIVCGVLAFSMGCVVFDKGADQAWLTIQAITVFITGATAYKVTR